MRRETRTGHDEKIRWVPDTERSVKGDEGEQEINSQGDKRKEEEEEDKEDKEEEREEEEKRKNGEERGGAAAVCQLSKLRQ